MYESVIKISLNPNNILNECQVMESVCKRYYSIHVKDYDNGYNTYTILFDNERGYFKFINIAGLYIKHNHIIKWETLSLQVHLVKSIMRVVEDYIKIPLPDAWYVITDQMTSIIWNDSK